MILNEDQLAIRDLARRFAKQRLAPHYQARETAGVMDRKLIREMGDLGLLGADLPEKFGGLGVPGVTAGVIAEELAYGDFNISAVPVGVSLLGAILMGSATPAVAEQWVPRMISGEVLLGICVTEPSGGSDAANLKLRCRRDGDFYVLNGEKTSITFADSAASSPQRTQSSRIWPDHPRWLPPVVCHKNLLGCHPTRQKDLRRKPGRRLQA